MIRVKNAWKWLKMCPGDPFYVFLTLITCVHVSSPAVNRFRMPECISGCQHPFSGLTTYFQLVFNYIQLFFSSFYLFSTVLTYYLSTLPIFDCLHLFSTIFTQIWVLPLFFPFFYIIFNYFHSFSAIFDHLIHFSSLSLVFHHCQPLQLIFDLLCLFLIISGDLQLLWLILIVFKLYSQIQTCFQLLLFIFGCYLNFWFLQHVFYLFLTEDFINYRY